MAGSHLSNEEFFTRLTALFEEKKPKSRGSIYLVQKRLTYNTGDLSKTNVTKSSPIDPLPLLIRATDGKGKQSRESKVKLSTIVDPNDLDKFYVRYMEVCKDGMLALKPRDRSKKKAKARKRKVVAAVTA